MEIRRKKKQLIQKNRIKLVIKSKLKCMYILYGDF